MSLFVYGTLRSEFENDHARLLRAGSTFLGRARVHGRLYRLEGYPGLKLSASPEDWVTGELYAVRDPEAMLRSLDAYERCGPDDPAPHEYKRVTVPAFLDDGRTLEAWVYVYERDVLEAERVASGHWSRGRDSA